MASGNTLATFLAYNNEPPSGDYATLDTRNSIPVLDFNGTSGTNNEFAEFGGFMPRHYDGGGITTTVGWAASSGVTGDAKWDLSFKSISDDADSLDTKSYAAAQSAVGTTATVSGEVAYTTIDFSNGAQMDSVAAGEYFRMKVLRDSDDPTDTINDIDTELVFVEIKEQ